ncbi:MAG: hypothetical protein WB791_05025 [Waddliaceae bacterium]
MGVDQKVKLFVCVALCLLFGVSYTQASEEILSDFPVCGHCTPSRGCFFSGNFYLGGELQYTVTNLPQNSLLQLFSDFSRQPNVYGEVSTIKTKRQNFRWHGYAGYQVPVYSCWFLGLEAGYRNLGRKNDRYIGELNVGEGLEDSRTPFRQVRSYAWDALLTLRYQHCTGLNFFTKFGAAWIKMNLKEGSFYSSRNPQTSFQGPYATYRYRFYNIYPELVVGAGFLITRCINAVVSYGHIFGPKNTARYIQELDNNEPSIIRRPGQCAGYDFFTVGVEWLFPK